MLSSEGSEILTGLLTAGNSTWMALARVRQLVEGSRCRGPCSSLPFILQGSHDSRGPMSRHESSSACRKPDMWLQLKASPSSRLGMI
jgi:hypothetical protein